MTAITRLDGDKRTAFVYILRHFLMINDMNDVAFLLLYSGYQDHSINSQSSLILILKTFFALKILILTFFFLKISMDS